MPISRYNNSKYRKDDTYISKDTREFLTNLNNPINLNSTEKLNQELYNLDILLTPYNEEIQIRKYLTKTIKEIISNFLNDNEFCFDVHSFGSSECNLYLPSSDIDIVILPKTLLSKSDINSNKILSDLSSHFSSLNDFIDSKSILHVRRARVPVLKVRNRFFGIEFDIIVNKPDTILQCQYIKRQLEHKPYLKPFCRLLKLFLKQRNLNDSRYGGLCSYAQFLLLLHFFEIHPLIQQKMINPVDNIGVLLLDFFQFFGFDFPYEGVTICNKSHDIVMVNTPKDIIKKCIKSKNSCNKASIILKNIAPIDEKKKNNDTYFYKKQSISSAIISIEDPIDNSHDVGDNCNNIYTIKETFQQAYRIMVITISKKIDYNHSLSSLWIYVDRNSEKWRKDIIEKFRNSDIFK